MLFNSLDFAVFLPIIFFLYWFIFNKSLNWQNVLLLLASYIFYGWWDWRFLSLIVFSTLVDFFVGLIIHRIESVNKRKLLLGLSLFVNLGLLGFFKYYNFFIENWITAWAQLGINLEASTLKIILPVGISFYTFQTLSYTIDIYRKKINPTSNLIEFAAFVSFFPQLVAGPIERASNLLPQFKTNRVFSLELAQSGIYLIIWGLFKKMVVADTCAYFVNSIFETPESHTSSTLFLGAVLFAFQIYGDFSGYSDIAIGTARLFGFKLMTNFKFPYFSRDIAEFWRRWHISLSTWFRDYLYIPLGGSRKSFWLKLRNVFIVFLVSGFWHGANWTFIAWGALHALLFLPLFIVDKHRAYISETKVKTLEMFKIITTFLFVTFAWVFFRAESISDAAIYLEEIFRFSDFNISFFYKTSKSLLFSLITFLSIMILLYFELIATQKNNKEVRLSRLSALFIGLTIVFMGMFKNPVEFIYFQF